MLFSWLIILSGSTSHSVLERLYSVGVVRVNHYTFSHSGGAGRVASVLAEKQRELGAHASLNVFLDTNLSKQPFRHPLVTASASIDRWVVKKSRVSSLTSFYRSNVRLAKQEEFTKDAVNHFHWMEGVASPLHFSSLQLENLPIVWTLHDMKPFTGFCHHAQECEGYLGNCSSCPQARGPFQIQISNRFVMSVDRISRMRNLELVAPTSWLAEKARASRMFSGREVRVIQNPIDDCYFEATSSKIFARKSLGIGEEEFVIAMVAEDLTDPIKRVSKIIEQFNQLNISSACASRLILIGANGQSFTSSSPVVSWFGHLKPREIVSLLPAADVLVSGSLAESSGLSIPEAGALAVPALVVNGSGSAENIIHDVSGVIVQSLEELGETLISLELGRDRLASMGVEAKKLSARYKANIVANKYLEMYCEMIDV